jgi:hypothetical protein
MRIAMTVPQQENRIQIHKFVMIEYQAAPSFVCYLGERHMSGFQFNREAVLNPDRKR